jgi:hypothetical protein
VFSARFSPDGTRAVSGSWDNSVRIWDVQTAEELLRIEGHADSVVYAEYAPDGARIISASNDGTARVWDAATGEHMATLEGHSQPLFTARYAPDGALLVTTSRDRTTKLWDPDGALRTTFENTAGAPADALLSADNRRLFTAGTGGIVNVWDVAGGELLFAGKVHDGPIRALERDTAGRAIVSASQDHTARAMRALPWDDAALTRDNLPALLARRPAPPAPAAAPHAELIVLTTHQTLNAGVAALAAAVQQTAANGTGEEGLALAPDACANAVARLALRPDDALLALEGMALTVVENPAAVLQSALQAFDPGRPVTARILRDGQPLDVRFTNIPAIAQDIEITLTAAQAQEIAEHAAATLLRSTDTILEVNHDFAARYGIPLSGSELAGVFVLNTRSTEEKSLYFLCRAAPFQRALSVNEEDLQSLDQIRTLVSAALAANGTLPASWAVQSERGQLQTQRIRVTISN